MTRQPGLPRSPIQSSGFFPHPFVPDYNGAKANLIRPPGPGAARHRQGADDQVTEVA